MKFNKKILGSIATIGAVASLAIFATGAFFSDTETSVDNTFEAGAIDLQVDYESTYNGEPSVRWELKDLTESDRFFDLYDLKPGDYGEGTISLHVFTNNAWGCVSIIPTLNDDMSSTEPELESGDDPDTDSIFDGELAQSMHFMIWSDMCADTGLGAEPGDNVYQDGCDYPLTEGEGPITPRVWALAAPGYPNVFTGVPDDPMLGSHNYYLGVSWDIPDTVGNEAQTDKYMADISFYVEQSRNNPNFTCNVQEGFTPNTLRLENEIEVDGEPWIVIDDQIYADLTWTGDGPLFDYSLTGQGLMGSTDYALIYYADGWPGNNPGAFIGWGTSDGSGNLTMSGTPDLGLDLPDPADGNYAVGAKLWLVLKSDYNSGNPSTGPMTGWQPAKYLFEGNVYIHYNDTNWP